MHYLLSLNSEIRDFLIYEDLLNKESLDHFDISFGTDVFDSKDPERWAFYFSTNEELLIRGDSKRFDYPEVNNQEPEFWAMYMAFQDPRDRFDALRSALKL